jgi:glycosyltransferase involved in cell wall biosynthesis
MEDLLDALVEIRRTYDATLVIVGGASRDDGYRNEVARRGLADAVIWTGFLTEQDAADAISATDLCVLPYRRNSIGRSALAAALTLGVPTVLGGVASRVAPLVPGTSVALTPPGNAQRLAETVCELLADPARRTALADGARAAATSFGWEHIASLGIDVYRSALSRG